MASIPTVGLLILIISIIFLYNAIKILKEYEGGMLKVLAWCADKDFPVECYQIPRDFENFVVLNQFFN